MCPPHFGRTRRCAPTNSVNPDTRAKLEARLKYYRDVGIPAFYRDRAASAAADPSRESVGVGLRPARDAVSADARVGLKPAPTKAPTVQGKIGDLKVAATDAHSGIGRAPVALPVMQAPGLFDAADRVEGDTLERIQADIGPDCRLCKLCRKRKSIVFGVGNPKAELVFVGEGPGADEDAQGEPFVGRAGKLLTQMIEAMGLKRSDVYICNVVKCRPPENRTPEPDEIATCSPFLFRQLDAIKPKVIVCLGSVAAKTLLDTNASMGKLRQQWFEYKSSKLLATYHPAYCLRNPPSKADVWKDLQMAMVELGLEVPKKKK